MKTQNVKIKEQHILLLQRIAESGRGGILLGKLHEDTKPLPYSALTDRLDYLRNAALIKNKDGYGASVNIKGHGLRFKGPLYISATDLGLDILNTRKTGDLSHMLYDESGDMIKQ